MIEIRQAKIEDAVRVSSLLMTNSSERGGALYGDWSIGVVTKWITGEALIAFAIDGSKLLGVLFTSEKAQASAEPVVKMLRAWPGTADAYVYGPVCIEEAARGQGALRFVRIRGRETTRQGGHSIHQSEQYPLATGPCQARDEAGCEL